MTFESLKLAPALLKAVQDLGYEKPTPIQEQSIPVVLSGVDLMAGAQTGTGKTGAFALPILHKLSLQEPAKNKRGRVVPRALVLAPTRELAAQIEESFRQLGKHLKLVTCVVYGGVSMNPQIQRMQRGVDIVIATPGRLLDLHQQGFVDLSRVQTLVLDEGDRMLDMGFIVDIRKIIANLPKERQNLLFSATFSDEIRELAAQLLHEPHTIQATPINTTVELIEQIAHPVARARKLELLIKLITDNQWYQVLIFTRTKFGANKVSEMLEKSGIKSAALHGNKTQAARTAALKGFKAGHIQAMVATDIAARGIDIDQLACVINYELPNISEDYVHRIGRTGRAGSEGVAINLVTVDEAGFMQQIESLIRRPIKQIVIEGFEPPPGEKGQPIVMGRQVIWGGLGRPPSRSASASAVKSARQQISQRKPAGGSGNGGGRSAPRSGFGAGRGDQRSAPNRSPEARFAGEGPGFAGRENRENRFGRDDNRGARNERRSSFGDDSYAPRARRSPSEGYRSEGSRFDAPRSDAPRSGYFGKPARPSAGSKAGFRSSDSRPRSDRPASSRPSSARPSSTARPARQRRTVG